MSQEKVREILSHVDMTKIDLSSFQLSEKKFDELATLYRNRVILSCVSMIACKSDNDRESVDAAFEIVQKVATNPNVYSYATIYANERKAVDSAIDDITTRRDRNINAVKLKAIEKRMKDAYKQMRKTIEMALENGNSFEYEFDEATVEKCLRIAKDAINSGREKVAKSQVKESDTEGAHVEHTQSETEAECEKVVEPNDQCEDVNAPVEMSEKCEEVPKKKVGFWKRIFGKV